MRIIFAGTPEFAASALAALIAEQEHEIVAVLTQPDRPAGRGMQLTASPVKQLALQHQLPVLQPQTLKKTEIQQQLAELQADVMVVAAYGLILPKAVLEMPVYGCLNIHASLLPRWRGAAPIHRAIQAGDLETGITIMQMDEGLDTGDMLLLHSCPIEPNDTTGSLHDKLAALGASSIVSALTLLLEKALKAQPQDSNESCYAPKIQKAEAQINWSLDADQLARQVRAFNPFPVCFSRFGELTLKIWQAEALPWQHQAQPGEILQVDKDSVVVACGQGALSLLTLQRPGGKAQACREFLQAVPLKVGDRLVGL